MLMRRRIALLLLSLLCCSVSGGELRFLVVGDTGGQDDSPYYTDAESRVAKAMGGIGETVGAQFVLSLGDNFYESGVTDVDDPRFKQTFEVRVSIYVVHARVCEWTRPLAVCMPHCMYTRRNLFFL